MKVKEIITLLEEFAPLAYAEDFDNTGLLVGDQEAKVTGILVTLDTLEAVVGELKSKDSARIHYELFTSLVSYHNKLDVGFSLVLRNIIEDFTIEWNTVQHVLALKSRGLKS